MVLCILVIFENIMVLFVCMIRLVVKLMVGLVVMFENVLLFLYCILIMRLDVG